MFKLIHRIKGFKIAEVWFAPEPFDISGVSRASFYWCKNSPKNLRGFETNYGYYPFIDLSKSIDEIKKEFNKSTRNEITRAEKEGVTIEHKKVDRSIANFHNDFIRKKKLNFPRIDSRTFKDTQHTSINAYINGNLIVSHLYIIEDGLVWLLLVASKEKSTLTGIASAYVNYKSIEWAKSKGYKEFSLSSIGDDPNNLDGIGKFKVGFSKDIRKGYVYTKYYNPILKALVKRVGKR